MLSDLIAEDNEGRAVATIQILDGLIDHAMQAGKYEAALKIMAEAREQFAITDRCARVRAMLETETVAAVAPRASRARR